MTDSAEKSIKEHIRSSGPITLANFMEMALYGRGGFYSSVSPVGASGDYFTAPSAHPAFGALIGLQMREMWQLLDEPAVFTVVEMGAGNGGLAADIMEFVEALDARFAQALDYLALDARPPRKQHYPVKSVAEAPRGITGCVISNELLDAMPVHRFEVRDGRVREIFIGLDGDRLAETPGEPSMGIIEERVGALSHTLPDGYRGEVNTGLDEWASGVASVLRRGWVLTIDYGFDRASLYSPERATGSLRCYYQHTLGQDPLRHVGRQDITAHVDFSAVDEEMTGVGFGTGWHTTQAEFLERLGIGRLRERLLAMRLPRPEARANEAGMHALTDPAGTGGFRVAAHSRNVPAAPLTGFSPVWAPLAAPGLASGQSLPAIETSQLVALPPTPLLKPGRHINLLGAARPQQPGYFEVQSLEELFGE